MTSERDGKCSAGSVSTRSADGGGRNGARVVCRDAHMPARKGAGCKGYKAWVCAGVFGVLQTAVSHGATTYYVATNGNNSNPGTLAAPFKTIQKAADVMSPGDACQIRGGVYREKVTVGDNTVTFQSYNGESVTVSGADPITAWTPEGGGVYRATTMPPGWANLGTRNQFFQGAGTQESLAMRPEARWPNAGPDYPWEDSTLAHPTANEIGTWSYVNSPDYGTAHIGCVKFTDDQLPALARHVDGYWTNATAHIMSGSGWIMRHYSVTGYIHSGRLLIISNNIDMAAKGDYTATKGNEYYLTGKKQEMDSDGEWFYDTGTARLCVYSSGGVPAAGVGRAEVKSRDYGFNLSGRSAVTLLGLDFFACTIQTDAGSTDCVFNGLYMKYLGHCSVDGSPFGLTLRSGNVLRNSELAYDSRGLVVLDGADIRVHNNHLHDSGYVPTWSATLGAINENNNTTTVRSLISHNTLHDSGHPLISFTGRGSIVMFNDLFNAMRLTTDAGPYNASNRAGDNTEVCYNLFHDSPGAVGHYGSKVRGFYLDNLHSGWIVHHNVIWGVSAAAMHFGNRMNFDLVFNNSCWDAALGMTTHLYTDGPTGSVMFNNLFTAVPSGGETVWADKDLRYNLYSSPSFANPWAGDFRLGETSPAIDAGTPVPGVTDGYAGAAPDMGALESGGDDWTQWVGCDAAYADELPEYEAPDYVFANKVADGSFERGSLSAPWVVTGPNLSMTNGNSWNNEWIRTGSYAARVTSGPGVSELSQTVGGLLSGRKYTFYCGVLNTNANAEVELGVRDYGGGADPVRLQAPKSAMFGFNAALRTKDMMMFAVPFTTGADADSAVIYVSVSNPGGETIYVDDLAVLLTPGVPEFAPAPGLPGDPRARWDFDETSGSVAHDASANRNDGSLLPSGSGPTFSGGALVFDGTNDYVDCGNDASLRVDGDLTLSLWICPADLAKGRQNLIDKSNYGDGEFVLTMEPGGGLSYYHHANGGGWWGFYKWLPDGSIQQGVWKHLAVTRDAATRTLKCYVNGILANTGAYPTTAIPVQSANVLRIGKGYAGFFKGSMDNVRVCGSRLDAADIRAEAAEWGDSAAWWPMDEGAGPTVGDASGNGNNGTLLPSGSGPAWGGGALWFDGADDYVNCGSCAGLRLYGDLTISFWLCPTSFVNGVRQNLIDKTSWADGEFVLTLEPDGGLSYYHHKNGGGWWGAFIALPGGSVRTNVWQHVTIIRDAAARTLRGYCNGQMVSSATYPDTAIPIASANPLLIGKGYTGKFKGGLADVRLFDSCQGPAITYSHPVVNTCVADWPLDEEYGTAAPDATPGRRDGTLLPTGSEPVWGDGVLTFDGANDYVNCGNDAVRPLNGDLTLSFWLKPTAIAKGRQNPIDKLFNREFSLTMETSGQLSYYHSKSGSPNYWSWASLPADMIQQGAWQHVTITREASTRTLRSYYNGNLVRSTTYPDNAIPLASTAPVFIGKGYAGCLEGSMSNVKIYNYSLPPAWVGLEFRRQPTPGAAGPY